MEFACFGGNPDDTRLQPQKCNCIEHGQGGRNGSTKALVRRLYASKRCVGGVVEVLSISGRVCRGNKETCMKGDKGGVAP